MGNSAFPNGTRRFTMRILFLSQLVPYPLDAGPKVRSYHVLRYLAAAGHEVTLLAFTRDSDSEAALNHLREFCHDVQTVRMHRSRARDIYHLGRSLVMDQPFLVARDQSQAMESTVEAAVQRHRFDAIHADQLWMADYALRGATQAPTRPLLVLDQHNAVQIVLLRLADGAHNALRRQLLRREYRALARYEREIVPAFDETVWVTAEDKAAVGVEGGLAQPVIPIAVNAEGTAPIERVPRPWRVTFVGGLHWPPNAAGITWFAREVWPAVRHLHPEAVLTVIGKAPPAGLAQTAGVEVCGYVDDPLPYLRETAAFIVPLQSGGGMRVKILDAWTWGVPVISTTIGAEGLAAREGRELLIADSPAAFVTSVASVLADQTVGQALVEAGRRLVRAVYDVRTAYPVWDAIYPPPLQSGATRREERVHHADNATS